MLPSGTELLRLLVVFAWLFCQQPLWFLWTLPSLARMEGMLLNLDNNPYGIFCPGDTMA